MHAKIFILSLLHKWQIRHCLHVALVEEESLNKNRTLFLWETNEWIINKFISVKCTNFFYGSASGRNCQLSSRQPCLCYWARSGVNVKVMWLPIAMSTKGRESREGWHGWTCTPGIPWVEARPEKHCLGDYVWSEAWEHEGEHLEAGPNWILRICHPWQRLHEWKENQRWGLEENADIIYPDTKPGWGHTIKEKYSNFPDTYRCQE